MPSYDFRCPSCSCVFEISRPVGQASEAAACPECHSHAKRVFAPVGVLFKGSGFHNTDYRAKPSGEPSGDTRAAASDSGTAACGASDACSSCPASK